MSKEPCDIFSKLSNGVEVYKSDIYRLNNKGWLNDNIIDFYLSLIVERGKESDYPSVYAFNTFFYISLNSKGTGGVLKWTCKIPDKRTIFDFHILFIPLHFLSHWALCTIDNRKQIIKYYDSFEIIDLEKKMEILKLIESYLIAEADDKLKSKIDPETYKLEIVKDIPLQSNLSDCGMFVLRYAECISRGADISFNHTHMVVLRKQMITEILEQKIKVFNGDEAPMEEIEVSNGYEAPLEQVNVFSGDEAPMEQVKVFNGDEATLNEIKVSNGDEAPVEQVNVFSGDEAPMEEMKFINREEAPMEQ